MSSSEEQIVLLWMFPKLLEMRTSYDVTLPRFTSITDRVYFTFATAAAGPVINLTSARRCFNALHSFCFFSIDSSCSLATTHIAKIIFSKPNNDVAIICVVASCCGLHPAASARATSFADPFGSITSGDFPKSTLLLLLVAAHILHSPPSPSTLASTMVFLSGGGVVLRECCLLEIAEFARCSDWMLSPREQLKRRIRMLKPLQGYNVRRDQG
ncbi:hypothetical protein KSP40_PGU018707 [Platanthera guangdongensis]|uniref:Uncharacterized protein n=1 Tax=Platanthera guangdongensis TaxID=2320717 RepID=A0ABR2MSW7_9ASPA